MLSKVICNDPGRVGEFVAKINKTKGWAPSSAIGFEQEGELVAGIVYDNFNGRNIFAHIAAVKGKHWLTKDFLWYMCHFPFNEIGVNCVSGLIGESNKEAIKFVEKLGANLVMRLKDAHPDGDLLIYRMFKNDCKYLTKR